MTKLKSKYLDWYQNELKKDDVSLKMEKINLINEIKKFDKEQIVPTKPTKISLWQRIKKVFMG